MKSYCDNIFFYIMKLDLNNSTNKKNVPIFKSNLNYASLRLITVVCYAVCIIYHRWSSCLIHVPQIKTDTYRSTESISNGLDRGISALIMWVFF